MKVSGKQSGLIASNKYLPYVFVMPNMVIFGMFVFWPLIRAFQFSTMEWGLAGPIRYVGLENFQTMFEDPVFITALKNTFIYTFGTVPVTMVIALFLAVILNRQLFLKTFYRSVIFFPVITSLVVTGFVWRMLFSTDFGVINYVFSLVGGPQIDWLTNTRFALVAVMIASIWKSLGLSMVIFLAGLQGIPDHLYESAIIDGATRRQNFWFITLPLLKPTTLFVLVISMIRSFRVFEQVYVMTQGGPGYSTQVMVMYIFREAFQLFEMGVGSAAAILFFFMVLVLTLLQMKYFGGEVEY